MDGGYPEAVSKNPRSRSVWFTSYIEGRLLKDFEIMHHAKGDYHSKLSALIRYLSGLTGNLINLVENFVFCELQKHATWSEEDAAFFHFRDTNRHELDLVIERSDGKAIGVGIKASMSVKPEDFAGLSTFAGHAGDRFLRGVLFYSGDTILPFRIKDRVFHALPVSSLWSQAIE